MTAGQPDAGCTLEDLRRTIEVAQARMEAKMDAIADHLKRSDDEITDLKGRLAAVERKVYTAAGAAALISLAVPYAAQALGG